MANIVLEALSKSYGALKVLSEIDLEIRDREFCVLVGPSGCGKSTLLRVIAGLEQVSSGAILIDGEDITGKRPGERDLAMVFQSYALYPHKTVRDNLGFSLRMRGFEKEDARARIEKVAATLGLEQLLDRLPAQLSGGQRQRVAMGRAIVRDPSVFLFDEPLSNLDAKLRVQMRAEIKDLHQRIGATTVYVTHDQIEAMTMADRIIVMNGGRIEQAGPPLELFDDPGNVFVAGFLGSPAINLIPAKVVPTPDGLAAELNDGTRIAVHGLRADMENQSLILGVRPHKLEVVSNGDITAIVKVVEPTGVDTMIVARVAGQDITAQVPRQKLPGPQEPIGFRVDPASVLVFDEASGTRVI